MKTKAQPYDPSIFKILFFISLTLLAAVFTSSCGNSYLSSEPIEDPTSIPAVFAVGRIEDASSGEFSVTASAIFKGEWLTTVGFLDGLVELQDPQGNLHPMEQEFNRYGAPFYRTQLEGELQLDAFYTFRVTLPSGRLIVNSVKTPAQPLRIHAPAVGERILKAEPLQMQWSGWNDRAACILLSPEPHSLLDVFEVGGKLAEDDGNTTLLPESMQWVGTGPNQLSLARVNQARANGFALNSTVGAVLLVSQPVIVE